MWSSRLRSVGILYGGSSIKYTSPSPLKAVLFKTRAAMSATAMPIRYIIHIISAWYSSAKNAGIISA